MSKKYKKSTPTTKRFLFYGEHEFNFDNQLLREFYGRDVNFKIKLYRIDIVKSKVDKLYGESKSVDKKFLPPIELNIVLNVEGIETEFLSNDGIFNEKYDAFEFGLFLSELEEKKCSVKRGDLFLYNDGLKERFFEITKSTNINTTNSAYGFKPFYIKVSSVLVKDNTVLNFQ